MVKKCIIITIFILYSAVFCMAQDTLKDSAEIVELVWALEDWPHLDGDEGHKKLSKFVQDNLMQIDTLEKCEMVYVQFEVDTLGFTHNHRVIKGVNELLDTEALRVSRLIKFDHPAKQRNKPIGMTFLMPIRFTPKNDPENPVRWWEFWKRKKQYKSGATPERKPSGNG